MSLIKLSAAKWRGAVKSLLNKTEHSGAEKSFLQSMSNNLDRFTNDPLYKMKPIIQADHLNRFLNNGRAYKNTSNTNLVAKLHKTIKPINPNRS